MNSSVGQSFRHFEEPYQDDFNSYTLSMAGVIKTFDNFTNSVKFRWGLGFGLSYVEAIPGQEQQLFVNRNVDSSRLLVYLELNVDYALDRILNWRAARNCFIGAIITHRSGAFGGSELLGGVTTLNGNVLLKSDESDAMYQPLGRPHWQSIPSQFIPYYAWSNRGTSEMTVWLPVVWKSS